MAASPTPIPSATVLILRDGPNGLEVFMVVRHHQIDFASGALVFPGGKVDPGDSLVRDYCDGGDPDDTKLALQVASIREAFEECGVLLARPEGSSALIGAEQLKTLEHYREPLARSELPIGDFFKAEKLRLSCDLLQPFAHWITPEMMPKRFDTYFYLAVAPEDHLAIHDGYESVDSVWIRPEDALSGAKDGTYTIIFPTRLNVELLDESDTVAAAIQAAKEREIVPVLPWIEDRDGKNYLCIPPDAGYAISEEAM